MEYSFVIFVLRVRSPLRFQARPAETYIRLLWVWGGVSTCVLTFPLVKGQVN